MSRSRKSIEELDLPNLPTGWVWAAIEDLKAIEANALTDGPFGSKLKTKDYVPTGVRVIRLGNIGAGFFKDDNRAFVSKEKFEELEKHEVFPGDLVIAALAEPVGRAMLVPAQVCPAIVKADCIRFKAHPLIGSSFVMHALNSPAGIHRAEALSHGIGRLRINMANLRSLPVPVAPQNEQRRIVAKIEALQDRSRRAREALEAVPPLLEKFRQSVLASAFRGDLTADWRAENPDVEPASKLLERIRVERRRRWEEAELAKMEAKGKVPKNDKWKTKYKEPVPPDTSDLPELPSGWAWATLDQVACLITSGSRNWKQFYGTGPGVFILAQNVKPGRLDLSQIQLVNPPQNDPERLRTRVFENDILVTIVGANTGDTCLVEFEPSEHFVCQSVALVRPVFGSMGSLLECFLTCATLGQNQFKDFMYGQGRPHLSFDDLRRTYVVVPPLSEQEQILREIKTLKKAIEKLAARVEKGRARFASLEESVLQKAFQGKLVPQDPNDEPADVLLERIRRERQAAAPKKKTRRAKSSKATRKVAAGS